MIKLNQLINKCKFSACTLSRVPSHWLYGRPLLVCGWPTTIIDPSKGKCTRWDGVIKWNGYSGNKTGRKSVPRPISFISNLKGWIGSRFVSSCPRIEPQQWIRWYLPLDTRLPIIDQGFADSLPFDKDYFIELSGPVSLRGSGRPSDFFSFDSFESWQSHKICSAREKRRRFQLRKFIDGISQS